MFKTRDITLGDIKKMDASKRLDVTAGDIQVLIKMLEEATTKPDKQYQVVSELGVKNSVGNNKYITPSELINSGITGDVLVEARELKMFFKEVWALEDNMASLRETVKSLDQEVRLVKTNANMQRALMAMDKPERVNIKGGNLNVAG